MSTINAKLIEQLDLIEPEFNDTEEAFKRASNSVKKDQFRIDKLNAKTVVIRAGKTMLRIKNTAQNLAFYRAALKSAHRTYPAGAYKRAGVGRSYPKFEPGMTTLDYIVKYCAMNDQMGLPPIDFDALGHRPAATYENGALDFDVIEEVNEDYFAEQATQDVAQVVAQAVATIAISEAMQPSETAESRELVTCEAGESEVQSVTVGSVSGATWAPVPQYVPCPPDKTGLGDGPAPAFRGDDGDTPTPPPAEFLGDATPPVTISSASFAGDIPLSLAVSAYNGVSMSPERRGASAKSEYAQSMAADYEKLHAQAVKGGTLDLLPEIFARYRARQSSAYKAYLSSSSRCVSSFIAGPSNFPAARMNKRSDIAHKRLGEYLNGGQMALQAACRTLRPDLRAIMAGDADAVDRLTVEISQADRLQNQMKAVNKAIRTHAKAGEAHQVAALMEIGYSEAQAVEILHPAQHWRGVGFPSYRLTNNQANIRRMRERLEKITAAKARPVETVECSNGVTLEDDAPANRVRLYFPGKPSEEIRSELKSNGFRWAPSVGAWQAYRNYGTLATAKRMAGEPVTDNAPAETIPEPVAAVEIVAPTTPAVESQPMAPVVETPDTLESFDDTGDGVSEALYEAVENATVAQVQSLTDAQFTKLYDHLENWNFHAENILLQALRTGVQSLIVEIVEVIRLKDATGCGLSGPLYDRYMAACRAVWDYKPTYPEAKQAHDVPAIETPKGQQVIGKSGKWSAYLYTWHDGKPWMTFEATSGAYECNGYDTSSERMKALQALARAADAPNDTPPGGDPCPEPVAAVEPVASVAPTPTVAVSSASPTPRVAVSSEFERVGNVRVDLAAMVAQGAKPESLIGLGVYYKGNMANPSGSGAITATGNSEWYGLIVDVTLESGMVWRAIRASEFKDGSFSLDAKMHGAPYMAELAAKVAAVKASESASKEIAATAHAKALIDLPAQYPQLKRAENTYAGGKLAAVNMRILLKEAFKGVKFSVTSDYSKVSINWTDGPSDKQVNDVIGRFDIGASDSQSDYFYTVSTAFSQLFGGVQYLFTRREVSDSLIQVAIDRLYADRSEKPTVTDYRKCTGIFNWNSHDYENRRMREMLETLGK